MKDDLALVPVPWLEDRLARDVVIPKIPKRGKVTFSDFQSHPVFAAFPETIAKHLYALMEEIEHPAGDTVLKEGDPGNTFFVVLSGELETRKMIRREEGRYKTLARLGRNDIFGEMAFFDHALRSADVVAMTDVVLWRVTVPCVEELIRSDPTSGANFLMTMITLVISRLRATNQTVAVLAEAGRLVSSAVDLPELTCNLFELISRELSGADSTILALYNWFSDDFSVVESMGGDASRSLPVVLSSSDPLVFQLTRSSDPILINQDSEADQSPLRGIFREAHSLLAAPFWYGKNLFGFVVLMNFNQSGIFTQQQLVLLQGLCHLVAPAMETFRYRSDEESRVRLSRAKGFTD